ncbi:unnamed protein product [Brassica rapa subsp. narinosa]|uniref:(rape) hypothetical protein n=1 Tax=Brassica napus TaxID=3708 RepID=A0A816X1V0_BRANA|nr:unnamed protein product [Brassica napus]
MWIRRSLWLWRKTWRGAKRRCYGRQETSPARRFACFTSIVLLGLPPAVRIFCFSFFLT